MLHYVQQLVDNFVCLLFGAVQIKYSWSTADTLMRTVRVNQNSKLAAANQNNKLNAANMLHRVIWVYDDNLIRAAINQLNICVLL